MALDLIHLTHISSLQIHIEFGGVFFACNFLKKERKEPKERKNRYLFIYIYIILRVLNKYYYIFLKDTITT